MKLTKITTITNFNYESGKAENLTPVTINVEHILCLSKSTNDYTEIEMINGRTFEAIEDIEKIEYLIIKSLSLS